MSFLRWCELCAAEGIQSPVCLFQINFTEAIQVCRRLECRDLLMAGSADKLFVPRDFSEMDGKSTVPVKTAGPRACSPAIALPSCSKVDVVKDFLSSFEISTNPPPNNLSLCMPSDIPKPVVPEISAKPWPNNSSLCMPSDAPKPVVPGGCIPVEGSAGASEETESSSLPEKGSELAAAASEEDKSSVATLSIGNAASLDCCEEPKEEPRVVSASTANLRNEGHNNFVALLDFPVHPPPSLNIIDATPMEENVLHEVEFMNDVVEIPGIGEQASPCSLTRDLVTEKQESTEENPLPEFNSVSAQLIVPNSTARTCANDGVSVVPAVEGAQACEASRARGFETNGANPSAFPLENYLNARYGPDLEAACPGDSAVLSSLRIAKSICSLKCNAPQSVRSSQPVLASSLNESPAATVLPLIQTNTDSTKELIELGTEKNLRNAIVQRRSVINSTKSAGEGNGPKAVLTAGCGNASKAFMVSQRFVAVPVGKTSAGVLQMPSNGSAQNGIGSRVAFGTNGSQDQLQGTGFMLVSDSRTLQQAKCGSPVVSSSTPKRKLGAAQNSKAKTVRGLGRLECKVQQSCPEKKTAGTLANVNNHLISKLDHIRSLLDTTASVDTHPNMRLLPRSTLANGRPGARRNAPPLKSTSSDSHGRKQGPEPKKPGRDPISKVVKKKRKKPNNIKVTKPTPPVVDLTPVCSPQPSENGSQSSKLSSASTSSGFCDSTSSCSESQRQKRGDSVSGDSTTSVSSDTFVRLVKNRVKLAKGNGSGLPGYHPLLAEKQCRREDKPHAGRRKRARSARDTEQANDVDLRVAQLANSEDLSRFDNVLADLFDNFA